MSTFCKRRLCLYRECAGWDLTEGEYAKGEGVDLEWGLIGDSTFMLPIQGILETLTGVGFTISVWGCSQSLRIRSASKRALSFSRRTMNCWPPSGIRKAFSRDDGIRGDSLFGVRHCSILSLSKYAIATESWLGCSARLLTEVSIWRFGKSLTLVVEVAVGVVSSWDLRSSSSMFATLPSLKEASVSNFFSSPLIVETPLLDEALVMCLTHEGMNAGLRDGSM